MTAKEIWDCVKELMEGTKMTKQERASMIYDEFDIFTSEPRESFHSYYLRYAKLINDMNVVPMPMSNISRYPPTNNQLRTLSNPRTQATIQNGQVMVQNVQGIQSQGYAGNVEKNQVILEENDGYDDLQLHTTTNFKADHVDAYDSYCDDQATTSAIFMASLSSTGSLNDDTLTPTYDSNTLSEVPHYDTYHDDDVLNSTIQEMEYNEHSVSYDDSYAKLTSDSNVISYAEYGHHSR
uniref:Integrase, catalytic region, zinc finger, CCHC-type, peptidase aspartic, catalytic n=1 Tax=Tanacetum cinerariifolium TaxID=118510 RepID=A0A699GJI7_TANCI|nr:hypothetical protein [Tanacetum cinerariifolium]